MHHDDCVYIEHMLAISRKAVEKIDAVTRDAFDQDENLRLALTYLLQVIGEAARHVSPAYQTKHASVAWKAITGMRHKVVHDYLNVDESIVWQTVKNDLPRLIDALEALVNEDAGK